MQRRTKIVSKSGMAGGDARGVIISTDDWQFEINNVFRSFPSANLIDLRLTSYATPVSSELTVHMGSLVSVIAVMIFEMEDDVAAAFDASTGEDKPKVVAKVQKVATHIPEAKTDCAKCGTTILQTTADRNNGLCMICSR